MLQLRADDPVLHGSQIAGLLNLVGQPVPLRSEITSVGLPAGLSGNLLRALAVRIGIADSIHDDLAETGCHRPDLRLDAVRQVLGRLPQPFANLLARKIKIGGFREYGGNLAEPIAREGPRRFTPRNAGAGSFDRVGDALLRSEEKTSELQS